MKVLKFKINKFLNWIEKLLYDKKIRNFRRIRVTSDELKYGIPEFEITVERCTTKSIPLPYDWPSQGYVEDFHSESDNITARDKYDCLIFDISQFYKFSRREIEKQLGIKRDA